MFTIFNLSVAENDAYRFVFFKRKAFYHLEESVKIGIIYNSMLEKINPMMQQAK